MPPVIKVGQVRDSIDIDRVMSMSSFAIVTKITRHSAATIITYDAVTDTSVTRNLTLGKLMFDALYPVVHMEHVRQSPYFAKEYRNI